MNWRISSGKAARVLAIAMILAMVLAVSPVSAARDRTPPTKPTNIRVTAVTTYSVTLEWTPSTDNSGSFFYVICCGGPNSATVSAPATSYTFTAGIEPGRTYSFRMFAQDAAGNKSKYSNTVSVTTPNDHTAPTAPALSVTEVGSSYVSLSWTPSIEDGPYVWYRIYKDGSPLLYVDGANVTSTLVRGLTPDTAYTFNVQARDSRNNQSPLSNTVEVVTSPIDPDDNTPPTTPGNLQGFDQGAGEAFLRWTQSTDNVDPQFAIRYEIFANGIFRPESTVIGYGETIAYAVVDGLNTFEVVAVDTAGNRSAPASITICMIAFC